MYKNRLSQFDDENLKVGASFYLPKKKVEKPIKTPKLPTPKKATHDDASSSSSESSSSSSSSSSSESESDSSDEEDEAGIKKTPLSANLSASTNRLSASKKKSALSLFAVQETPSTPKSKSSSKSKGKAAQPPVITSPVDLGFDDISATFVALDDDDDDDFSDDEKEDKMGDMKQTNFDKSFSQKEAEVLNKSKKPENSKDMTSTPSFVKSMNEYMVRRMLVEEKVNEGHIQAEHVDTGTVHVTKQADLTMYSEENQMMRSKIKRSSKFQEQVKRLWALVSSDEKLNKSQYTKMITKICRLIIPPPIHKEDLLQTAMDDWDQDLKWAQEHDLIEKTAIHLNYDAFFKSIFELVDTWTESAQEKEYIDMILRLIDGVADDFDNGRQLRWKRDESIKFDAYFSFRNDPPKKEEEEEEEKVKIKREEYIIDDEKGPSILEPMGLPDNTNNKNTKNKKKKKRRKTKQPVTGPPILPVSKVYLKIAQIYQLKQQADLWASTSNVAKPIRFDKFVLRCFMQEFGTRKIARRHLRHFVTSAQRHLNAMKGEELHPRIYMFCVLSGIIVIPPTDEFNPRYSAEYFQPSLRYLFSNPRTIVEVLGDGSGDGCLLLRQAVEKAVVPINLQSVLGGPFAIKSFKSKMKALTSETAKGHMVNLDKAIYVALDLWRFSDTLRTLRERAALKIMQRFFKQRSLRKEREKEGSLWLDDDEEEEGNVVDITSLNKTSMKEKEEEDVGKDNEVNIAMPSPRIADKLSEAKQLDQQLNKTHHNHEVHNSNNHATHRQNQQLEQNNKSASSSSTTPLTTTKEDGGSNVKASLRVSRNTSNTSLRSSVNSLSNDSASVEYIDSTDHCDPAVEELLLSLNLGKFIKKFAAEDIDMAALKMMSEFDLAEISVSKGARVKIRAKVASMSP